MPISSQYAFLSEDRKTLVLPDEVQGWLRGVDRFVVGMENDELILRKAPTRRTLDELVTNDAPPLSSEDLSGLIHESRK